MYNLVMKDLKLGVHPAFFAMPFLTGALMLIPGWVYFVVILYFCWITVPNMFGQYKAQNDLMFTSMMPVTKQDMVKARVAVLAGLEVLHLAVAMMFGMFTLRLYPSLEYFFFPPYMGFWGLCFAMLAVFNLVFIPMFYKTAYKYGSALFASITAAMLFAGIAQWAGLGSPLLYDVFYGDGIRNDSIQAAILIAGIAIFIAFTYLAYRIAERRFLRVEI